jgi:hypothetical protein
MKMGFSQGVAAPPETADFGDALSDLEAFRLIQLADPISASPETYRAPGNENAGRGASRVESRHARPQPDSCRRLDLPTVCHLVPRWPAPPHAVRSSGNRDPLACLNV